MGIRLVEEVMDNASALGLTYREKWTLAVLARDANEKTRLTYHHATDEELIRRAGVDGDAWVRIRSVLIRKGVLVVVEPGRRSRGSRYFIPVLGQLVHPADAEAEMTGHGDRESARMTGHGDRESARMTGHGDRESARMTGHGDRESARMTGHGDRESAAAPYMSSSQSSSTTSSRPVPDLPNPRRSASTRPREGEIEIENHHMRRAYDLMETALVLPIGRSHKGALALATAIAQRLAVGRPESEIRENLNRREPSRGADDPVALQLGRINRIPLRSPGETAGGRESDRSVDELREHLADGEGLYARTGERPGAVDPRDGVAKVRRALRRETDLG